MRHATVTVYIYLIPNLKRAYTLVACIRTGIEQSFDTFFITYRRSQHQGRHTLTQSNGTYTCSFLAISPMITFVSIYTQQK